MDTTIPAQLVDELVTIKIPESLRTEINEARDGFGLTQQEYIKKASLALQIVYKLKADRHNKELVMDLISL